MTLQSYSWRLAKTTKQLTGLRRLPMNTPIRSFSCTWIRDSKGYTLTLVFKTYFGVLVSSCPEAWN